MAVSNEPNEIMAWPDFDSWITGKWSANTYDDERAIKFVNSKQLKEANEVYVRFPQHFIALPLYPGYFWNLKNEKLYTMKITGVLRPLKKCKFRKYNGRLMKFDGYAISVNGRRQHIDMKPLKFLTAQYSTIPVQLEMKI